jgi:hypothetical protein
VSAGLSATRLRELQQTERMLARPLTTVRRMTVVSIAPFPTASLARLIARMAGRYRTGRILHTTPEWANFREPSPERLTAAPPGFEGLLRVHGTTWVAAPGIDDRFFDVSIADGGVLPIEGLADLARSRDAVCLVVPTERAAAEGAVALAEQLTLEGRRVAIAFDHLRPGRVAWARAVSPRLAAPAVTIEADTALTLPARPPAARTLVAAARLAGHLMTDPAPTPAPAASAADGGGGR